MLALVPVFFRDDRGRADLGAIRRGYDEYRGLTVNPEPASGVDLDTLFDRDLLWAQPGDPVEVYMESLSATRALIEGVGWAIPVPKKGHVDLIQRLAG